MQQVNQMVRLAMMPTLSEVSYDARRNPLDTDLSDFDKAYQVRLRAT